MIVYKIWSADRLTQAALEESGGFRRGGRLRRAIRTIVESGLLYSISVAVFFVLYLTSNNALYGVSDCVSPLFVIYAHTVC